MSSFVVYLFFRRFSGNIKNKLGLIFYAHAIGSILIYTVYFTQYIKQKYILSKELQNLGDQ